MAMISEAEKYWKTRITDEKLTDEQRSEAALRYDRIVKRRTKKKSRGPYAKRRVDPEPASHSATCAKSKGLMWCTSDCPWGQWNLRRGENASAPELPELQTEHGRMLSSNMLLPNLILLIDVTFSTPTPVNVT